MSTYGNERPPADHPYGHPGYGQPQPYGQVYPQPSYGQYGVAAARPGGVVTAAVLGFIWGTLGVLVTGFFLILGAVALANADDAEDALPGFGEFLGAAAGFLIFVGVLALAWTVAMIWGSVWALNGRSRVLLIVGGAIAIAATGLMFIGGIASAQDEGAGGAVLGLIGLVVSILIVVLLVSAQAAAFFAAGRAARYR